MTKMYDLIVIGAGSGGIATAVRAAMHGARVAIIEKNEVGGTCVNLGCVPKKVMWYASDLMHLFSKAQDYGFNMDRPTFDWQTLCQHREAYIQRLRGLYQQRFEQLAIDKIVGHAAFVEKNKVKVGDRLYGAPHIVIATGGSPTKLNMPGIEYAIDSDKFFELTHLPKKVAIIGGGYIGVELAGVLNGLGSEVHLYLRKELPLSGFDCDIQQKVAEHMKRAGITLHPQHSVQAITAQKELVFETATSRPYDAILLAVGRTPNTTALNLQKAGIVVDEKGHLAVDEYQQTNIEGHYAIGDITLSPPLTPVAIKAGRLLAERLFNQKHDAKLDTRYVATVVFAHPPVGTIGLTEEEASKQYETVKVYHSTFNPMFYALSDQKTPTFMKLVTVGQEEKVVGLHMLGKDCDEILQGFAVAITMGLTKKALDACIAIHPTSAEELVTMR